MSLKSFLSICALIFFPVLSFSQSKQFLYYFDKDLNATPKESAVFNGIGQNENGLLEFKIFNASTKKLLIVQHFTDSSLRVSEGGYEEFYETGILKTKGSYTTGKEDGLWQIADSAGRVIDSSYYNNGRLTKYIHRGYYKGGYPDSIIINDLEKNELQKTFYLDSGVISNSIVFIGNTGYEIIYDKGVISKRDTVFSREEIEASFPGGEAAWSKYIVKGLQANAKELFKDNVFGTCKIKFIVDKEGNVKDVVAENMKGTKLAETGIKIIRKSPKWKPASQYGRLVNAYRIQPVTLQDPD
jgi:hypothetical protein